MSGRLRPPGAPIRVAELLLPTVLTLAGRGPVSAKNFLMLLASTAKQPAPKPKEPNAMTTDQRPEAGTRVTAGFSKAVNR